jgi:hypothetical protein
MSELIPNFETHDCHLVLACNDRRGLWAAQVQPRYARTVRTAGSMPTAASAHTLLTVALISSLRNITKAQEAKMARRGRKSRLLIRVLDSTFADALKAKIKRQDGPRFRAGKNFLMALAQQLARFDIDWETVDQQSPDFNFLESMRHWAGSMLPDPKSILAPSAVSILVPL